MLLADLETRIIAPSSASRAQLAKRLSDEAADRHDKEIARLERLEKRRAARRGNEPKILIRSIPLTEEQLLLIEARRNAKEARHLSRATYIHHRLHTGYVWAGGEVAGLHQRAFVYEGLKSKTHPLLTAFVAMLPKLGNMRSSADKVFLYGGGDTKLAHLDAPYIEGNKRVRGFIRIDIDATFSSWGELYTAIDDCNVPIPNIATGGMLADGRIRHPHLIWMLPFGNGIRFDDKAMPQHQRLLSAVARGLCAALLPIGADPGSLSNSMRLKNPLSPHWATAILNERTPGTLRELSQHIDFIPAHQLAQAHVQTTAERDGVSRIESNGAFNTFRKAAFETLRAWHRTGDTRLNLVTREATCLALMFALRREARAALAGGRKPKQAMAILRKVCVYAAAHFDPGKLGRIRENRGILNGQFTSATSIDDRRKAGAAHTAETKKRRTIGLLADYLSANPHASKAAIARDLGLSRDTVYRLWDEAVAASSRDCTIRCIVKKLTLDGSTKNLPSLPSDDTAELQAKQDTVPPDTSNSQSTEEIVMTTDRKSNSDDNDLGKHSNKTTDSSSTRDLHLQTLEELEAAIEGRRLDNEAHWKRVQADPKFKGIPAFLRRA